MQLQHLFLAISTVAQIQQQNKHKDMYGIFNGSVVGKRNGNIKSNRMKR